MAFNLRISVLYDIKITWYGKSLKSSFSSYGYLILMDKPA